MTPDETGRRGLGRRAVGVTARRMRSVRVVIATAAAVLLVGGAARAEAYVYWPNASTDTIGRANLDGSGVNNSFVSTAVGACGVAVDSGYVYWAGGTTTGYVGRASLSTQVAENTFITAHDPLPCGVAVDGSDVYWDNYILGAIGRANLDGSNIQNSFIPGGTNPQTPAVGGGYIYWVNKDNNSIGRADFNGSNVDQNFIATGVHPVGVAVDSGYIYWASPHDGTIGRANLNGSGVNGSFISGVAPCGVAVDSSYVYWGNGNTIGRANLDGTGVNNSFITTGGGACGVAVDSLGPSGTGATGGTGSGGTGAGGTGAGGTGSGGTGSSASCDPILGTCDQSLIVCVGLWTETCAGPLASPPPVQTCVSLFQSCSGFGAPQSPPGIIDMSGFPASVSTTVGCAGSNSNPFTASPARASAVWGALRPPTPLAHAADTNPTASSLSGTACLFKALAQSTDATAQAALDYADNLETFKSVDISIAKAQLQLGLGNICKSSSGALAVACINLTAVKVLISAQTNAFLEAAGAPGKPVDTNFTLDASVICQAASDVPQCTDFINSWQAIVVAQLQALAARKTELGLDQPPPPTKTVDLRGRAHASDARKRKRPRTRLVVLAYATATLTQGAKSTLTLHFTKFARKLLRTEHAHGLKTVAATVIVQATLIPGVSSTNTGHVRITFTHKKK